MTTTWPYKGVTLVILQHINVSNQHTIDLKLIHCYMSIISQWKNEFLIEWYKLYGLLKIYLYIAITWKHLNLAMKTNISRFYKLKWVC